MVRTPFSGPNDRGGGSTPPSDTEEDAEEETDTDSDGAEATEDSVPSGRRRFRNMMGGSDDSTDMMTDTGGSESDNRTDSVFDPRPEQRDGESPTDDSPMQGGRESGDSQDGSPRTDSVTSTQPEERPNENPGPDTGMGGDVAEDSTDSVTSTTPENRPNENPGVNRDADLGQTDSASESTPEDRPDESPTDDPPTMTETSRDGSTNGGVSLTDAQTPITGDIAVAASNYISNADIDTDVTTDLTQGGLLSDRPGTNEGLLPGSAFGVDLSSKGFTRAANDIRTTANEKFESNEEFTVLGSDLPDRLITGAAKTGVSLLNLPQYASTADTISEVGVNAPGVIAKEGIGTVAETSTAVSRQLGSSIVEDATENPAGFVGGGLFGYVTGAKASEIAGRTARLGRDRIRTAGGTRVDLDDVTSEDVIRNVETDGAEGTRFPGADDPDTYQTDPAEAVTQQADEMTPNAIEERFEDAGVEDGTVLKKAVDTEPSGGGADLPGTGTSTGFKTRSGDFESPGAFVGPELSPNFLRTGTQSSLSLRPGLPSIGNKPTGVLAKTEVENVDADTLQKFNEELVDRTGDTTALTKPASEVNTGEVEAVLPPAAEFSRLSSNGLGTRALRRFGVGADFYTEVDGRRVPLRPVAPSSADTDAGDIADAVSDSGQRLDEYVVTPESAQDNTVPVPPSVGGGAGSGDAAVDSGGAPSTSPSTLDVDSTLPESESSGLPGEDSLSDIGTTTSTTTGTTSTPGATDGTSSGGTISGDPESGGFTAFPIESGSSSDPTSDSPTAVNGPSETVSPSETTPQPPTSTTSGGPSSTGGGSGLDSPFGGGGSGDSNSSPVLSKADDNRRRPEIDGGDESGDERRDRDRGDDVLADLFDNPTISPEEALKYDPLEDG